MADIFHDFSIEAPADRVFLAVATPEGIDNWWSCECRGKIEMGEIYELSFGPGYDWTARVTRCLPGSEFELKFEDSDGEWTGTQVGFELEEKVGSTHVRFHHVGWPEVNEHYRISSFCWAMYLRILKRYVELGEQVPYEERLNV